MAEEKSRPQYARIEQPFGCEPPVVHCPICGQPTIDVESGDATPCPHLAFIYVGAANEYAFTSVDYDQKTEGLDDEDVDLDSFSELLSNAGYGNNLLALEVTYGGMACGPVWYTEIYGFDYGSLAKEKNPNKSMEATP